MELTAEIKNHLAKADAPIIFEFGANNCADVYRLNELMGSERGMIYAWEADPDIIQFVKDHDRIPKNTMLVECAVSNKDGKSVFYTAKNPKTNCCGSGSLLEPEYSPKRPKNIKFVGTINVSTRTLDSFCEEHNINDIDLVLADIQGAEYLMVEGGIKSLACTKYMSLEICKPGDYRYKNMRHGGAKMILGLLPDGWQIVRRVSCDVVFRNSKLL